MSMIHIASNKSDSALTNIQPEDVQPNAVDLRAQKLFLIDDSKPFIIGGVGDDGKERKTHRGSIPLEPQDYFGDGILYWKLEKGRAYEALMDNLIGVAIGESGWKISRSTLVRNGLVVFSGLYDAGYGLGEDEPTGAMGGVIYNPIGDSYIAVGTRVAQFVCVEAETVGDGYDGDYQKGNRQGNRYS